MPRLILFDLDGTLVDTVPDLAYCLNVMLQRLGRLPHSEAEIRNWIGNGIERLVHCALLGHANGKAPAEEFFHAYQVFLELYTQHNAEGSTLYPGVQACLDVLRERNYPLACVTNKASRFVKPLLSALNIEKYFDLIVAGDSLPHKKPDAGPLLHAAAHFNVMPSAMLMVGDSVNDVQAARAAGAMVVCVSYGYNHGKNIHDAAPDVVIDTLTILPTLLAVPS